MGEDGCRSVKAVLAGAAGARSVTIGTLQVGAMTDDEVFVRVRAASISVVESAFICVESEQNRTGELLRELLAIVPGEHHQLPTHFVPGLYFLGEVARCGRLIVGLSIGEHVMGIMPPPAALPDAGRSATDDGGASDVDVVAAWGCYRETICVPFSALLPVSALPSNLRLPAVVAHIPHMVSALTSVSSHLRLRQNESLLILTHCLRDVVFVLQRLLLMAKSWRGPLYLIVLEGAAPTSAELRMHPLLRPLLAQSTFPTCLDDMEAYSVADSLNRERHGLSKRLVLGLGGAVCEAIEMVATTAGGAGFDVVFVVNVDLAPVAALDDVLALLEADAAAGRGAAVDESQTPPSQTILRCLVGALALGGRLVTTSSQVEIAQAEARHLWAKGASISFHNPHSLMFGTGRRGHALHVLAEVIGRISRAELALMDVTEFRLFEQLQEAALASRSNGSLSPLPVLVV